MENKELEQAAKEFCEVKHVVDTSIKTSYQYIPKWFEIPDFLAKFAQYLLDSGKMVEADAHQSLKNEYALLVEKYNFCRDEQEEDRQEYNEHIKQLEQSNTPQSGEVKSLDECLDDYCMHLSDKTYDELVAYEFEYGIGLSKRYTKQELIYEAAEIYANQFKNPAYDLLLASYNTLKAEDNKKAMEINRLMAVQKVISDKEIEKAGYADCGDKTNHRFTSADEIEPWIEGAKWGRDQLNKQ